jgi:hypothetical protein
MAYDLELWFIRSILFIGIAPNLGPKLVMIRKMVRIIDLLFDMTSILYRLMICYSLYSLSWSLYSAME